MRAICYSIKDFEAPYLEKANSGKHFIFFEKEPLVTATAHLAKGFDSVIIFTGDDASQGVLEQLHGYGVKYIALRSAGYDNVHLETAHRLGLKVANVPAYSPYAIAEHTVMLMLALNRKLLTAHTQVQQFNFSLSGLTGFDLNGKTAGIIGTGHIGSVASKLLHGFGCNLLGYDIQKNQMLEQAFGMRYTSLNELFANSDIITIHTSLNATTRNLVNHNSISKMKDGVMLINTSRGAVVDTAAVIEGLKSGKIGSFGMDVYEHEKGLFFYDHSGEILQDDMLARLMVFHNVIITPHQAFLTREALTNIADSTIENLDCWKQGKANGNEL